MMTHQDRISQHGTNGYKALDYTKCFESRDPIIISQYTPGQWFKPTFEDGEAVPKFQLDVGTSQVIHMKRKGLLFCFSFTSPVYLLAGKFATPIQFPDFPRNLRTKGLNALAVRLWDSMAEYADKAYTYNAEGKTNLFNVYMQAFNLASKTYAILLNF